MTVLSPYLFQEIVFITTETNLMEHLPKKHFQKLQVGELLPSEFRFHILQSTIQNKGGKFLFILMIL